MGTHFLKPIWGVALLFLLIPACKSSQSVTVPTASFSVTPGLSADSNTTFTFTAQASSTTNDYTWDLGDGTVSNDATLTHQYAQAGTYDVTLTVSNSRGDDTQQQTLTVLPVAPTNLSATAGAATIILSWTYNASEADSFTLYRRESTETDFQVINDNIDVTNRQYIDNSVDVSRAYVYAITANVSNMPSRLVVQSQAAVQPGEVALGSFSLTVLRDGVGQGVVTSTPAGISCETAGAAGCTASFKEGTSVTLTATAAAGSTFSEWRGACSGSGACTVVIDNATQVTAVFTQTRHTLNVSVLNAGTGQVTSVPAGIDCTDSCASDFIEGTDVTLLATPAEGFLFSNWQGACSGAGRCNVTVNNDVEVQAVFIQGDAPVITSLTATPRYINPGQESELNWTVTGDGDISVSLNQGIGEVTSNSYTVTPDVTTTYKLTATSIFGETSEAIKVRVGAAPVISSFTADDTTLTANSSTTLSWTVSGDGNIKLSLNKGIGDVSNQDTQEVTVEETTTYTLTASSPYGETSASLTITIGTLPQITAFSASPGTILKGEGSMLSWNVTNANKLSIDTIGEVTGTNQTVFPSTTTTYTLRAQNDFGTSTASTTITVTPAYTLEYRRVSGDGGVTIDPGGVTCSSSCTVIFEAGTDVTLKASNLGASWEGCDSVSFPFPITCSVKMDEDKSILLSF